MPDDKGDEVIKRYQGQERPFDKNIDLVILHHAEHNFETYNRMRLDLIRYYFLTAAIFFAAYSSMWATTHHYTCAILSTAFMFFTYAFYLMDKRTLQFIEYAENAISVVEAKLQAASNWAQEDLEKISLVYRSDQEQHQFQLWGRKFMRVSHRDIFYKSLIAMALLSVFGVVASLNEVGMLDIG